MVKGEVARIDYGVRHVFLYRSSIKKSRTDAALEFFYEIGNMIVNVTPRGKAFLSLVWLIGFAIGMAIGIYL